MPIVNSQLRLLAHITERVITAPTVGVAPSTIKRVRCQELSYVSFSTDSVAGGKAQCVLEDCACVCERVLARREIDNERIDAGVRESADHRR